MSRMCCGLIVLGVAILTIGFAATARADLLFSDNFDGADASGTDYGLNANLDTRQSGDNAGVGWVLGTVPTSPAPNPTVPSAARVNYPQDHGVADALSLNGIYRSYQAVNINHNFTDAAIATDGGFTLRFDMAPIYTSSLKNVYAYWTAVGIGGKKYTQHLSISHSTGGSRDRSLMLKANGSYTLMRPSNINIGSGVYDAGRPSTTTGGFTCPIYTFELRVATIGFTTAHGATGWLYFSTTQGAPSNALTLVNLKQGGNAYTTWTWDSDNTNYIGFCFHTLTGTVLSNSNLTVYNMIDNVSVWSGFRGTPEPSTLILVGTGMLGLLAYAWRRRRR